MHDRMLISDDEPQDCFGPEGVTAGASPRKPTAADRKMQALVALFTMGCLPAETANWIASVLGHTLRS